MSSGGPTTIVGPDLDVAPPRRSRAVALAILAGAALLVVAGASLYLHARAQINGVALSSSAKAVTVVEARAGTYTPQRHYVATLAPWIQAHVGPQFVAAYTDTVLVRPGALVRRGQVLATLDCRDTSAMQRAISEQSRAIAARQVAQAHEAAAVSSLVDAGFAPANDAEQKLAASESELAQLMAAQAKLASSSLAVSDCILRAPFDGEIAERMVDPGAFVRPGTPIVSVVDRTTIRVLADVPEGDFGFIGPGTAVKIHMLATGQDRESKIARRSPAASDSTRTVHFEIDLPDPERSLPVGTTAELTIDVGQPQVATVVPSTAANIRGKKADVFVVDREQAKKVVVPVEGESTGTLYLDPSLAPGSHIVTDGRSLLNDGDRVASKLAAVAAASIPVSSASSPGGTTKP